jgi:hypothetical protein
MSRARLATTLVVTLALAVTGAGSAVAASSGLTPTPPVALPTQGPGAKVPVQRVSSPVSKPATIPRTGIDLAFEALAAGLLLAAGTMLRIGARRRS